MDKIKPELVDELLKGYQKPEDLIGENGLLKQRRCQEFCVNISADQCFGPAILVAPERRIRLCGDAT